MEYSDGFFVVIELTECEPENRLELMQKAGYYGASGELQGFVT
jgi:hypothetical protein